MKEKYKTKGVKTESSRSLQCSSISSYSVKNKKTEVLTGMKKLIMVVAMLMLFATVVKAEGLNMVGQSGGFYVPDAQIAQRLTLATHYINMDGYGVNTVSITGGVFKNFELGFSRVDLLSENINVYHAKAGLNFDVKPAKIFVALGVDGGDIESVSALNYLNYYAAGQCNFQLFKKNATVDLVARSSDSTGEREYTGEALVGIELVPHWSVFSEFRQNVTAATNNWSLFVRKANGIATIDAGVADTGATTGNQFFLGLSISL